MVRPGQMNAGPFLFELFVQFCYDLITLGHRVKQNAGKHTHLSFFVFLSTLQSKVIIVALVPTLPARKKALEFSL